MIHLSDISIFKSLIGDRIDFLASSSLHVYEDSITIDEKRLALGLKKNTLLFVGSDNKDFYDFFENEDGEVFYDYEITKMDIKNQIPIGMSSITFNTSEIIKIEIYGRNFNCHEFVAHPKIYKKVKGITQTDDIFLFKGKSGEKILIVFSPFLPHWEVYFKQKTIEMFWHNEGYRYKLHHSIK